MATSQGHGMLSLRFLVAAAAACGKVLIAFVHKHGAAQNAEDDFLVAILQHELRKIKEKEGGERAIEVFMEKIATGGGCLVGMEVETEAPGEQGEDVRRQMSSPRGLRRCPGGQRWRAE
ncbi:hypothetical protein THAOC_31282 [Thalassiosira oceanica]|uniref:Uncharacterized protein n=1 Tax=Thalassiosira oceanica TaxID=159749 RepID=K0RT27_THAOC|nr:hypothetical protein THAOC_31282 [Thalassiosira oceanica]|eukprot:EJK49807.1 hypothetical protein THAOC_31282 [Thalassiosira oceanica]